MNQRLGSVGGTIAGDGVSGAWSKACDQWQVDGTPEIAALLISRVLWNLQYGSTVTNARDVSQAGSAIRAWRKSLPDQGERMWDFSSQPSDTDLLWIALRCIGYAQGVPNADSLRSAEAALRTWWKRQVQS